MLEETETCWFAEKECQLDTIKIILIAAMTKSRVIGIGNRLPNWKAPGDLKRFKELTLGKAVVMGRKTFESLGCKPLYGRYNIVITSRSISYEGVTCVPSVEKALKEAVCYSNEIMVIGGQTIYEQTIGLAHRLYITVVNGDFEGDAYFPEISPQEWELTNQEDHGTHSFLTYDRFKPYSAGSMLRG